jgi:hypothetical protein
MVPSFAGMTSRRVTWIGALRAVAAVAILACLGAIVIGAIHAPLLFRHSPEDVVVPIAGRKQFDAGRGAEVSFLPAMQSFLRAPHLLP